MKVWLFINYHVFKVIKKWRSSTVINPFRHLIIVNTILKHLTLIMFILKSKSPGKTKDVFIPFLNSVTFLSSSGGLGFFEIH